MFYLTKHEKSVLLSLAVIVVCGSASDAVFKWKPETARAMTPEENFVHKTDVNTADFDELVNVPYIGEVTARAILDHRRDKGAFRTLEEIQSLPGVYFSNYTKMVKYLKV